MLFSLCILWLAPFSAINGVTALYRISRCLTSRAGRLRRKEASFVVADRRFQDLVEFVERHARALDRVGLENRKWAYHKLMLPTEYRARAAHAVRQLDKAKDLQGDLLDATDVETILVAVEDAAEIFNKVNVSTAVHRVARLATTNARDASFNVLRCGGASAPSRAAEITSASIAFLRARFASASALAAATRSRSTSAAASFTAASRAACSAGSVGLALAALDAVGDFFFAAAAAVAGGAF